MNNKTLGFRIGLAVVGTLLLAISINFIIGINWGMSTYDTACLTTQYLLDMDQYGDAVLVTHAVFLVLIVIFLKKLQSDWKQVLIAIVSILVVSRVINMFGFLIDVEYASFAIKFIVFMTNVFVVNLAIYLMANSQLVATPYDRFVIQLSAVTGRDLGNARLIVDVITFIIAFVIIIIADLPVPISFATLFIVVASGPIITMWGKILKY
ncbi:hypothetical protein R2F61_06680 [Mollicutes bacterium LVI A0078]|nr:hypothetical protein RZE84_06685 [Mollicutes bacterium LVI A0075]WOO90413.1 hypothetical protein R2F61_06680 [Mollicutes bacterium LVI A0078]